CPVLPGPPYLRDIGRPSASRYNLPMWIPIPLIGHSKRITDLTECPKGHERTITCDARTPEQEWLLTCPLCGAEHTIVAPSILHSDL
ncbi:MAG TPA: hypothetical protein VFI82_16310, partial [Terriglobales bacterium]|nr:hypothetical protein [Terriglobales bacterium]